MPPQNMPLWNREYFDLKALRSRCKKSSLLCPYLLKVEYKFTKAEVSLFSSLPGRTKIKC
jgi:hypothetical protein